MKISTPPRKRRPSASKERMVFYLDPAVARLLKRARANTDKPMSHIVEEAIQAHPHVAAAAG